MFEPVELPYEKDSLEPYVDADTMEVHYEKHYKGYTSKLNAALEADNSHQDEDIEELLLNMENLPDDLQTAVRKNGGGYFNHGLFWVVMSPEGGGEPSGDLAEAIEENFGDFEQFKSEFSAAAAGIFGSGWAWLIVNDDGELEITTTANQDNPLMPVVEKQGRPILGLDVWEHAYYLMYQNKRPDYIEAWWNVVNWDKVEDMFSAA